MDIPPFEELLKQIKTNFWLLGIPYDDHKIYIRFYVLFTWLLLMAIEEVLFLISKISTEDLLVITQLAPCCCIGTLSLLKMICLASKRKQIFILTRSLKYLYNDVIQDTEKRAVIRKNVIFVNIFSKYFFVLNVILISVYNFSSPIFMLYEYIRIKKVVFSLPYEVIVPFRTDTWLLWFVVYVQSVTSAFICILFFTTADVLFCIMTSHICNHFALISKQLLDFNNTNDNLGSIVKKHQHIIQLSQELEEIFNLPNLFNVMVGSLEICALGFNLTMGSVSQIPGCLLFLVSVLLQILLMSVFGENLIEESKKIGDAVFSCEWYNLDEKSKKMILIILTRAHKSQKLTAYKFSTICYGSFSKIISTSWSYFTILKTVYKPSESHSA